ncbi:MAG TPA: hypothetical protein VGX68_01275 [Thermoanaerobaculia bacterium]|jgi:hypothetical protein|nr:hypothetical protein [Thermoanaerobaculia bacterium]
MRTKSEWVAFFTALSLCLPGFAATVDPEAALAEGNRRFRRDETAAALDAYVRGYAGGRSPTAGVLAYNAGTCALRLGRLPEALLWYRRAEVLRSGDQWLRDNLILTRRALGDPPEAEPVWGIWLARRRWIAAGGVVLAWAALGLLLVPRTPRGLFAAAALLACTAFAAGTLPGRIGPRPAVLLAACPAPGGNLPAGSEVWVRAAKQGGWRVFGEGRDLHCPANAVGLVEP